MAYYEEQNRKGEDGKRRLLGHVGDDVASDEPSVSNEADEDLYGDLR